MNTIPAMPALHNTPDTPAGLLTEQVLEFLRVLQNEGFHIGVGERLDALKVCRHVSIINPKLMYWGLQSLVATNPEEWTHFDSLFRSYWLPTRARKHMSTGSRKQGDPDRNEDTSADGGAKNLDSQRSPGAAEDDDTGTGGTHGGASRREISARTDFRFLSDAEQLHQMERWVEQLARRMKPRLIRRQRLFRIGRRIHLRRTIRNSLPHGGTPLDLAYFRRRRKLPRLILLLDVSRSMTTYSYLFLRFARGIVSVFKDAEAFVFHTRLVHVTDALRQPNVYQVKQKLDVMSMGWSGGTRIGECLHSFNTQYGRRLVGRRSIVVVLSDGLDTGDTDLLAGEVAQIQRRARKLIWLNPLLGREGYQPLAAGMGAALPSVDLFGAAHDFNSLCALESAFVNA